MSINKLFYSGSENEITERAAMLIITEAYRAVADRGKFSLVLAGGNSPRPLYQRLAAGIETNRLKHYGLQLLGDARTELNEKITFMPWQQTWLFWGDERYVPFDHPESNYKMAKDTLLMHSSIADDHLIRIDTEQPDIEKAAKEYESSIRTFFQATNNKQMENIPVFDFVLLGLGEDGHTASLFADNLETFRQTTQWVLAIDAPHAKPPVKRLTLTLPVINHARNILFFTLGKDKAVLAKKIFLEEECGVPAAFVAPENGRLFWFTTQL